MPQASSGNTIADSAQINPGVVQNSDLASDAVKNNVVDAAAAIAMSKLNLAITNSEVAAGAAIVDTKLAQIATASKVSGAALTSLASIPAGAGVVPEANLPVVAVVGKTGTFSKSNSDTTTTTIAHGLGKTPKLVRLSMQSYNGTNAWMSQSFGAYDGTSNGCVFFRTAGTGGSNNSCFPGSSGSYAMVCETSGGNACQGAITVDGTNITITYTNAGSPAAGTSYVCWEAIG